MARPPRPLWQVTFPAEQLTFRPESFCRLPICERKPAPLLLPPPSSLSLGQWQPHLDLGAGHRRFQSQNPLPLNAAPFET